MPDPLILASNSLGRRELMTLHGYAFTVAPSHIDEPTDAVAALLRPFPRPWVAAAAGAKWLTKRWPVASFAALLNRAAGRYGGTAVLVGSPDDTALSLELAGQLRGPCLDLTGKTSLPRLVAVLKAADAMVEIGRAHV